MKYESFLTLHRQQHTHNSRERVSKTDTKEKKLNKVIIFVFFALKK